MQTFGFDDNTLKDNDINFYKSIKRQYPELGLANRIHQEHEDTMQNILSKYNISSQIYHIHSNGDETDINEFNSFIESKFNSTHKPIAIHLNGHWILLTGINGNIVSIYNSLPAPGIYNNAIMNKRSFYNYILSNAPTDGGARKLINILVPNSEGNTNDPELIDLNIGGTLCNTIALRSPNDNSILRSFSYYRHFDRNSYFVLRQDRNKHEFNSQEEILNLNYENLDDFGLAYSEIEV